MSEERTGQSVELKICQLLEEIVADDGIEVLKVSLSGNASGKKSLRVFVDRHGGIETNELEKVSRALSLQLDVEDLIHGAFNLEVSSPGLEWPLTTEKDFLRYADAWLRVEPHEGQACEGRNLGLHDGCVQLQDKTGKVHTWPQSSLRLVTRAIDWAAVSNRQKNKRG